MTSCLLIVSDGRIDYLRQTLASAAKHLFHHRFDQFVFVNDEAHQLGFAGAIAEGWRQVRTDWVFHLEEDFTFNVQVPVEEMIALLQRQPHLAQVSLKRQAWNERELAAGGIVEADPDDFADASDDHAAWTEHRRYWTTNPSVYSSRFCRLGWPQEEQSEGVFTHRLLEHPELRFAIWGEKHAPPLVHHIGDSRAGGGY